MREAGKAGAGKDGGNQQSPAKHGQATSKPSSDHLSILNYNNARSCPLPSPLVRPSLSSPLLVLLTLFAAPGLSFFCPATRPSRPSHTILSPPPISTNGPSTGQSSEPSWPLNPWPNGWSAGKSSLS